MHECQTNKKEKKSNKKGLVRMSYKMLDNFYYTPTNEAWEGYTGVTLSVRPFVTKFCLGHNFKSIKGSNFKHHTQIGHIVEKCSVQEP